jgi:hypothetical protein
MLCGNRTEIILFFESEMQRLSNAVWRDLYQAKQLETVTVTNNAVSNLSSIPQKG